MSTSDAELAAQAAQAARAADLLEATGWCQGHYRTNDDRPTTEHCLVGAVVYSSVTRNSLGEPGVGAWLDAEALWPVLVDHLGLTAEEEQDVPDSLVVRWNDEPGRTQDEVVQVLRDVATKLTPDAAGGTL